MIGKSIKIIEYVSWFQVQYMVVLMGFNKRTEHDEVQKLKKEIT